MKKARFLAWMMAAVMSFSCAAPAVFAEEAAAQEGNAAIGAKLEIGEMGKGLVSMMAPVDLSWLNNADVELDATVKEGTCKGLITVSVNETAIAAARLIANIATQDFEIQIPELSDIVLTGNASEIMKEAEATVTVGGDTEELSEDQLALLTAIGNNLSENPPSMEVLGALSERYMPILAGCAEMGEPEEGISYTISGITQEAASASVVFTGEAVTTAAKELLTAAKDDEDLKGILENAVAGTSYEGVITGKYEEGVAKLLESLEGAEVPADVNVTLKALAEPETGAFLGGELLVNGESFASLKTAKDGDTTALDLTVNADVNGEQTLLNLAGSGASADGSFKGEYVLSMDEQAVFSLTVDQAVKEDGFEGHYVATPIVPEAEEEGEYSVASMLEGFSLLVDVEGNQAGGTLALEVTMGGSTLARLTLRAAEGETVEFDLPADAERVALTDEEAMNTYMAGINIETILTNLQAAGMTEEFLNQLMGGGEEDADYAEEEPAA